MSESLTFWGEVLVVLGAFLAAVVLLHRALFPRRSVSDAARRASGRTAGLLFVLVAFGPGLVTTVTASPPANQGLTGLFGGLIMYGPLALAVAALLGAIAALVTWVFLKLEPDDSDLRAMARPRRFPLRAGLFVALPVLSILLSAALTFTVLMYQAG